MILMHVPEQCHAGITQWKRNRRSDDSMALCPICAKKADETNEGQNYPLHRGFLESCHDPIKKAASNKVASDTADMVY